MARPPDWFDRLDALQAILRASEIPSLGRREMQELFACSERESLRLLNRFGAVKIGDTLQLARRPALLTQLEALRASRTFQLFRQKQQQLSETMAVARPASKARFRRIAGSVEFSPPDMDRTLCRYHAGAGPFGSSLCDGGGFMVSAGPAGGCGGARRRGVPRANRTSGLRRVEA